MDEVQRARVMQWLRDHGPASAPEIAAALGLSSVHVRRVLEREYVRRRVDRRLGDPEPGVRRQPWIWSAAA